jgi:PI-3-kinase-related kinase SMG-1
MVPDNGRYIRRSLDLIAESLLDVLHSGPGSDAKSQAAKCLGRVGYVLEQDFKRLVILYPVSCVSDLYSLLKFVSSYVK